MPRELGLKVIRKRLHHRFSPAERLLFLVDRFAEIPVERQEFSVSCPQRLVLATANAGFDLDEKGWVVWCGEFHRSALMLPSTCALSVFHGFHFPLLPFRQLGRA